MPAELIGHNITGILTGPDDCWKDVCDLRSYDVPDPVATSETAFARAGVIQAGFDGWRDNGIGARMVQASQNYVRLSFENETGDILTGHYHASMVQVARVRTEFYRKKAFNLNDLAAHYAAALGVPGMSAIEITPLFEQNERRIGDLTRKVRIV